MNDVARAKTLHDDVHEKLPAPPAPGIRTEVGGNEPFELS